ncbi:replication-associated recombination protein A, partial [Streptococcus suis]
VLMLDEIHLLNKNKQDFLLPRLENVYIILIGSTTENPFFSILPAIRSPVQIFELQPLKTSHNRQDLEMDLTDSERGFD